MSTRPPSAGHLLEQKLRDSVRDFRIGAASVDPRRRVIWGVTDAGTFVDGMTADAFHHQAGAALRDSGRVYRLGNAIVFEDRSSGPGSLATLAVAGRAEPGAASSLANLVAAGVEGKGGPRQSLLPSRLVQSTLADESLAGRLPEIRYYARRPTFDPDFQPCRPGWNPEHGYLVHGPEVGPIPWEPAPDAGVLDRLPPRLRGLLGEIPWRSDADLVNAVSLPLTGLLINHFLDDPHPAYVFNGNQPGIGKTLAAQVAGRVLDGVEPQRIPLGRDEEVEKRLCSQARCSASTLFLFDNARAKIESAVLEQNILSPTVAFRILGQSTVFERPNTYLWATTSNQTAGTPDFLSRAVPIRLHHEGDPRARAFAGDPLDMAGRHRDELLGELAGMVLLWAEAGRPAGARRHRCRRWAATIGGILDVAGLGGPFLANLAEAESAMDPGLLDLATLAEHAAGRGDAGPCVAAGADPAGKGQPAGRWAKLAGEAGVLRERLAGCSTSKARAALVGQFLGGKVDRPVPIETAAGPGRATLRKLEGRSRTKHFYFEVAADPPAGAPAGNVAGTEPAGGLARAACDAPRGRGGRAAPARRGSRGRERRPGPGVVLSPPGR